MWLTKTRTLPVSDGSVPCPIRGACDTERCLSCAYLELMTVAPSPSIECRAALLVSPVDQALVFVSGM